MNTQISYVGGDIIYRMYGELNEDAAPNVRSELERVIRDNDFKRLVLDFAGVTFMNSTGLGIILCKYNAVVKKHRVMSIANPNRQIDKVLSLSGIYSLIEKIEAEV